MAGRHRLSGSGAAADIFVAADRKLTQVFYFLCLNIGQATSKVITMKILGRIRRTYVHDKLSLHEILSR